MVYCVATLQYLESQTSYGELAESNCTEIITSTAVVSGSPIVYEYSPFIE
jgi:hypothetical protein